jgi:hypothetical protein
MRNLLGLFRWAALVVAAGIGALMHKGYGSNVSQPIQVLALFGIFFVICAGIEVAALNIISSKTRVVVDANRIKLALPQIALIIVFSAIFFGGRLLNPADLLDHIIRCVAVYLIVAGLFETTRFFRGNK